MAQFSGAVKLADLNDFIAPSQSCVVSLKGTKLNLDASDQDAIGEVQIQKPVPSSTPGFSQTKTSDDTGAIKVTLHDCLACSGCITSAETVLLQHQSTDEFLARLSDPDTRVVVSIAPQSRAALAAFHGVTPLEAMQRLAGWLKGLGVAAVVDVAAARDLSLLETAAEFMARYNRSKECSTSQPGGSSRISSNGVHSIGGRAGHHSSGISNGGGESSSHAVGGSSQGAGGGDAMEVDPPPDAGSQAAPPGPLPMLASACPGWVCYAEKTHAELLLPHLATAKSPMAVAGALIKRRLAAALGVASGQVYHCAVMPCYDKKLEASRDDLRLPGTEVAEVDCCLTTVEVQGLLEAQGVRLPDAPPTPWESLLGGQEAVQLAEHPGGSGGYLEYVLRTAAEAVAGVRLPVGRLQTRAVRNADLQEYDVVDAEGGVVLRGAAVYGFRNIQTLVRQLRLGRCRYDFVEVMACPSGCLNGGGQLKPAAGQTSAQLLEALEVAYHHQEVMERHPGASPLVPQVYGSVVGGEPYSAAARQLLHTGYHKREKSAAATVSDW